MQLTLNGKRKKRDNIIKEKKKSIRCHDNGSSREKEEKERRDNIIKEKKEERGDGIFHPLRKKKQKLLLCTPRASFRTPNRVNRIRNGTVRKKRKKKDWITEKRLYICKWIGGGSPRCDRLSHRTKRTNPDGFAIRKEIELRLLQTIY